MTKWDEFQFLSTCSEKWAALSSIPKPLSVSSLLTIKSGKLLIWFLIIAQKKRQVEQEIRTYYLMSNLTMMRFLVSPTKLISKNCHSWTQNGQSRINCKSKAVRFEAKAWPKIPLLSMIQWKKLVTLSSTKSSSIGPQWKTYSVDPHNSF